jgi:predicted permease
VHGNQAILGLAVVFYGLGEAGISTAGLIVTAIILMQNLLSVVSFVRWGEGEGRRSSLVKSLLLNPIILATVAGLGWSLTGWRMPAVLDRTLQILGNMGLPLALLIIGSNLARGRLGGDWKGLLSLEAFKLLLMPAVGLTMLTILGVEHLATAVTVILLASPTATISIIMAGEMGGDSRLSSQAVTLSHALSAFTYTFWLWWLTG